MFRGWPVLILAFGASAAFSAPTSGPAPAQRLDGIAAVVNNEVVLQSDVEEQLNLFLLRAGATPDSAQVDTLRRKILDQLIDEHLIVSEADRQKISVSDADVEKEVDGALAEARQRLGSEEAFQRQLRAENLTEEKLRAKYRSEVRRQLLAQRLVQRSVPRKSVTAVEAEAYWKAHRDRFPKAPPEALLSVVLVAVEPESSVVSTARQRAAAALKRIRAGEKFAKVAQEVSEDPGSAQAGGDLGYFGRGRMDPNFEKAAFGLAVGKVSDPVRSDFGWHLIEVLDRDTLKAQRPKGATRDSLGPDGRAMVEVHARHILIRVIPSDSDVERARKQAERVRGEALKGTDFASLARRYSKLEGADEKGNVGWVSYAKLNPMVRAAIDTTEMSGVTGLVPSPSGFSVFKVNDKRPEREYALEEIRNELPEAVAQLQFKERYDDWLKVLRAKAHIEIRGG